MVFQEPFGVEQFMDKYETSIDYNMGETCVDSLTMQEIVGDASVSELSKQIFNAKLTYGHIKGSPQLRKAIASLYGDKFAEDDVIVTNGAIGANYLLFYAIVNPGDHILVIEPSYQQLSSVPKMFGGKVDPWKIKFEDGYQPNLAELEKTIARRQ